MKARRLAVMVITAMLLSTTLVAPAAATTPDDDDDGTGFAGDPCGRDVIGVAVDMLQGNFDKSTECRIKEIRQGNQEQEMQDIHSRAETLSVSADSFLDGTHNSLQNARTVAWTKAEVATLNALENNSSQAETRVAARTAVRRYYSRMLQNVIADRNAKWEEFEYLDGVRRNESLNSSTFYIDWAAHDDRLDLSITNRTVVDRYNYTLPNGTVVQFAAMDARGDGSHVGGGGIGQYYGPLVEGATLQGNDDYGNDGVANVDVFSEYNGEQVHVYNGSRWWSIITEIESQNQQMLDNMNSTVNGLYGSYVRGELDIDEYQSTQAAAMDSSQDLREAGWMFYSAHALASAGATVPNLSETGSITIETAEFTSNNSTEELTGLFVGDPPGYDNWTVGTTYYPEVGNQSIQFLVSGENRSVELTEEFTVVGAENRDGQEISVVEPQTYNYRTNNYSELGDKLDRLIELRQYEQEQIEEASQPGDGGGIGWPGLGGGSLGATGGLVIVGVVAVALFAARTYLDILSP